MSDHSAPDGAVEAGGRAIDERDLLAEEVENASCVVCGALGPCGFTDEGEPLIHGSKREPPRIEGSGT